MNHARAMVSPSTPAIVHQARSATCRRASDASRGSAPSWLAHPYGCLRSRDPANAATKVGPR